MHTIRAKTLLSKRNGMNIYRGCTHGCIYCDSRSTCYHMNHSFTDVEIKINAPELLEKALSRKRNRCMIGTGAMSDPYIPLEKDLCLTRKCLEITARHGFGISLLTKSDLVLRDLDLLTRINKQARTVVSMTLTTYDNTLSKILEPHVCTTQERIAVLRQLAENGIDTAVWLCPILPFINDTEENLLPILEGCVDAGVKAILCFGFGLTLREGNREYFYEKLDELMPGMRERYEKTYGTSYSIMSRNNARLMNIFTGFCKTHNIICKTDDVFAFMEHFEDKQQMTLF